MGGGLLSDGYKAVLQATHAQSPAWGSTAYRNLDAVKRILAPADKHILDYGCGKGALKPLLETDGRTVDEYDPGIPGKDSPPTGYYDTVLCIDVLEHVEPESVDAVLSHILSLGSNAFLVIDTVPAKKTLSDGRKAHLTVEGPDWWKARLLVAGAVTQFASFDGRRLEMLVHRA